MMPEAAPVASAQKPDIQKPNIPNIIVFRDKLLLPSEGFIKTHYSAFDAANLVYLASQFGWRAGELDGQTMATASGALQRFVFKQTAWLICASWPPNRYMRILDGAVRWPCRWHRHWVSRSM